MNRSRLLFVMLATGCTIMAQNRLKKPIAGEPPRDVRSGHARMVGHYDAPTQMRRLAFGLATPHPAEEEQFLEELRRPGSPQFHKFLTADQWNARFSPSVEDEQAVMDWATSEGMTVTHRFANRLIVDVEAPMATIEKALKVKINNYVVDGYTYFANENEPVLPARLANIIVDVEGLHNFPMMMPATFHGPIPPGEVYRPGPVVGKPRSQHADGDRAKYEKARAEHANLLPTPNITSGNYDPTDIYAANAYDYDALQNQGHCCNPNHNPGGSPPQSSIAIAAYGNLQFTGPFSPSGTDFTDIVGFQAQYPYLAFNITAITIDGGPGFCTVTPMNSCGQDLETTLDTEWTTATANSFGSFLDTAHVFVYEGEGGYPGNVYNQILSDGNARVFTSSFSCGNPTGEDNCPSGVVSSMHSVMNSMAGQGWTMMTASGDAGATADCATTVVEYPASDTNVVGVGGTTLFSGGLGGVFNKEVAWSGNTGPNSCKKNNGGSTGGCSTLFTVPGFQVGSNGTCGTQRGVPDISLNANFGQNMFFNGSLFGIGGTSIASPMVAGFFAQEGAYLEYLSTITGNNCGAHPVSGEPCLPVSDGSDPPGMGNGNTYLYFFGQNPSYAPHYPFYDITSGCNSNDITTANPALTFYCAGTGYDLVTGWGTANMLQLAWAINSYIAGDFGPPNVNFAGVVAGKWYNVPQTLTWTVADTSGNGAVPNGVAGFSQAWDSDPGDVFLGSRASTNNSYFTGPQFPNATAGLLTVNLEGCHTANVRAWDNGGTSSNNTFLTCFDNIPPVVACGSSDGVWHATDVTIHCTASDTLSGLAIPSDANFNLTTSVPANTETNNACTGSHSVSDVAGNSSTGDPVCGNMVDKTKPVIAITSPTATTYTHSSTLTLSYTVTDTGSGVGTVTPTMNGSGTVGGSPIVNGLVVNLLTALPLGSNTFAITASDKVLNTSSASVTFTIIVTPASIIGDVNQLAASGGITMNTNPLLSKLQNALTYFNAGDCVDADALYQAFINQVNAQTGKGITPAAAAILIADAQYLQTHCP